MRLLCALFTALTVVGFAGAAAAMCGGYQKSTAETADSQTVIAPPAVGS
jgi:hypothetical protein